MVLHVRQSVLPGRMWSLFGGVVLLNFGPGRQPGEAARHLLNLRLYLIVQLPRDAVYRLELL